MLKTEGPVESERVRLVVVPFKSPELVPQVVQPFCADKTPVKVNVSKQASNCSFSNFMIFDL